MANLGTGSVDIYQAFVDSGGNTSQLAAEFPTIEFQNGMVGLQVKSLGGDFSQFLTQLTNVGMQVTASSAYYGLVDGWVPVNELPTIAELPQTRAASPIYNPVLPRSEYQGAPTTRPRPRCSPTPPERSSTSTAPA